VRRLLPQGIAVLLVGDGEYGSVEVLRQLEAWPWAYVLRQKTSTHVCLAHASVWRDFGSWIQRAGQSRWLGQGYLTEKDIYPVNLLIHWAIGEEEPWCLAIGARTIRAGLRPLVDRKDRRDLSIFQIGLRFLERQSINDLSVQILLCSYR